MSLVEKPEPIESSRGVTESKAPGMEHGSIHAEFLITAYNNDASLNEILKFLKVKYGTDIELALSMPKSARAGELELYKLKLPAVANVENEARELTFIPGIINAEPDIPLSLNTGPDPSVLKQEDFRESALREDGFGTNNEEIFHTKYKKVSKYVKGKSPAEFRKWNWIASNFEPFIALQPSSPADKGIRIVQFDTGFTAHSKVKDRFDTDIDFDFINSTGIAEDPLTPGILKQPGHGTRTGSLLIGNEKTNMLLDGNKGFFSHTDFKLIPFRIAESVILINRQQQLADALDHVISHKYDVITMSMGMPPTIATAMMAKKAYDHGVIWCCAAGNQIQAVVAPAVYPGTIAIAASNPLDEDWKGSSRGDAVDITAPGQDVYVPIFTKPGAGGLPGEDMAYGDGTSYATPHIAAAAAFWLAKYKDELEENGCTGWRRVEAFRTALRKSARKKHKLPGWGFGAGILDADKLMNTAPKKVPEKNYAYRGIHASGFFQLLQAQGEIIKTYWNIFHGWISGSNRSEFESMESSPNTLSDFSRVLEQAMFNSDTSAFESAAKSPPEELQYRLETIFKKIEIASRE